MGEAWGPDVGGGTLLEDEETVVGGVSDHLPTCPAWRSRSCFPSSFTFVHPIFTLVVEKSCSPGIPVLECSLLEIQRACTARGMYRRN